MQITSSAYESILSAFPAAPPEHGGIIGGRNGIVSEFCHDSSTGPLYQAIYEPDAALLNETIEEWHRSGIECYGVIHSHPEGQNALSEGDLKFIASVMAHMETGEKLYFPVVLPGKIIPYSALKTEDSMTLTKEFIDILLDDIG